MTKNSKSTFGSEFNEDEIKCFQAFVEYFSSRKDAEFYKIIIFGYARRIYPETRFTSEIQGKLASAFFAKAIEHDNLHGGKRNIALIQLEMIFKGFIDTELSREVRLDKSFTLASTMTPENKGLFLGLFFDYIPSSDEYYVVYWEKIIYFVSDWLKSSPKVLGFHLILTYAYLKLAEYHESHGADLPQLMDLTQTLEARMVVLDTLAFIPVSIRSSVRSIIDKVNARHRSSLKKTQMQSSEPKMIQVSSAEESEGSSVLRPTVEEKTDGDEKEKEVEEEGTHAQVTTTAPGPKAAATPSKKKDRKAEKRLRARARHQKSTALKAPSISTLEPRNLQILFINPHVEKLFKQIEATKKVREIFEDIILKPWGLDGSGHPEILRGGGRYKGCYSRHIDKENRLVYKVDNQAITIYSCQGHY